MALVRELHKLDTDVTSELARATTMGRRARADLEVALLEEAQCSSKAYERYLEQVLRFVALEATVRRLTQEIARTTRQVNALENVVLPALEAEATQIAAVLDEREREEHSRLERARDRRAEQHQAEAGAHAPTPHDPPTTGGLRTPDRLENSR